MKTRKWKKTLLTFVLIGALLGVQVMEMVAFAAETGTDALEPSVVCSNMSQLYSAIIQANDGDVIGIDKIIHGNSSIDFALGDIDKHVTIVRMNADAYLKINTTANFTVQNITFDGNGITANYPMVMVYSKCTFDDVTIQNCITCADGGAVQIYLGNVSMNQCTFKNNKGNNGGHIAVFNGSVLNMTECTLTEGQAGQNGGAIYYNSSAAQYGEISSSVIHANSAGSSGGGIYVATGNLVLNSSVKLYGNTAPKGEDMTVLITGSGRYTDNLETLNLLFADENIKVNGWEMTQDPDTATKYYKLYYEEIVQEQPGDSEDTGDDTTEPSDPGTGEDITDPSVPGEDEGDNQEDTTQPGDSDQDSTEDPDAGDSDDSGQAGTEGGGNTDNSSNNGNTTNTTENSGNTTNTDNSSNDTTVDNSSNDVVTDNSDHSSTDNSQTDNSQTTTDNSDHSTTTNTSDSSSHDTITTNNSSDNSNKTTTTDNSQRSEDNSSVVTTYNYYQNPENTSQVQSGQQMQPIVVNNYIQPSKEGQQVEEADDPSNNIKIDAEGVDVVFEVVDGVYSISIKAAKEPQVVQTVQDAVVPASSQEKEPASSVNWYEIIKIGLLVAILVNVMWKPRQNSPA